MPAINHARPSAPVAARPPRAGHPVSVSAHPAAPLHHAGTAVQHSSAVQHTTTGHQGIRPATLAESEYVASPYCERCGTDEFIYLEAFVPATHRRDGAVSKLGEVTYFCSGCDDFSAHAVPASWVPPGWYFG
ncbi:hypothetical protein ACFVTM_19925 [Arthrobacter sp. NPDC058130]|uniref:hypothetical protein n=1 Tax=Arthrobacter sp. NPDC058130 TaxID=3346353 RepID=UPI0036E84D14